MHCYGHALSLSVADTIKMIPLLGSTMDTTHEVSKLLQYSPKRGALFKEIKAEISPDTVGFRILCPTRWTVHNETFRSIMDNYDALMELWETILNDRLDSETRARVNGVASQMKTFDFFFGACLLHSILRHTDNLSKTMQHTKLCAAEGQHMVRMTISTLQSIRSEEMFKLFWQKTVKRADELDIGQPALPRKRKAPRRLEVGTTAGSSPTSPEDHYRAIYFEAVDTVSTCIGNRFKQEGYGMYCKLEQLLLKGGQPDCEVDEVLKFYGSDFDKDTLLAQLHLFHVNFPVKQTASVHDVVTVVKGMSVGEKALMAEVIKLVRLLLVMPATNAISKRSFSAMRRIKTYLRSTMLRQRLNGVMILHIHKMIVWTYRL